MKKKRIIRNSCRIWISRSNSKINTTKTTNQLKVGRMMMDLKLVADEVRQWTREHQIPMRAAGRTSCQAWAIPSLRHLECQKIRRRPVTKRKAQQRQAVQLCQLHQARRRCRLLIAWSRSSRSSSRLGAVSKPSTQDDQALAQSATRKEPSPSLNSSQ